MIFDLSKWVISFVRWLSSISTKDNHDIFLSVILCSLVIYHCLGIYFFLCCSYGRTFNKHSKIAAINRSKKMLSLNRYIFWNPTFTVRKGVPKAQNIKIAKMLGKNPNYYQLSLLCGFFWLPLSFKQHNRIGLRV